MHKHPSSTLAFSPVTTFCCISMLCLVSACAQRTTPDNANQTAVATNPATAEPSGPTSRLRLFGRNGRLVVLSKGSACNKGRFSKEATIVSGGFRSAFGAFSGKIKNVTLGIPMTINTEEMATKSTGSSKIYFRELIIPGDVPSSILMEMEDSTPPITVGGFRVNGRSDACQTNATFTPKAGADYEATVLRDKAVCTFVINQVSIVDGKVILSPMPLVPTPDC